MHSEIDLIEVGLPASLTPSTTNHLKLRRLLNLLNIPELAK